ncbi:MAG: hypothetical protein R3343_13850 [Nitriliruptorales bacterium]|nr:hypothetical protein [Nitriliruptorales bacterium]
MNRPPHALLTALGVELLGEPAAGPGDWREQPVTIAAAAEDAGAHVGVVAALTASLPGSRSGVALTGVSLRLSETIPTDEPILLRVRRTVGGHHEAEVQLHDRAVAEGEVEIAGRDPAPKVPDLVEMVSLPFGEAAPDHRCDVFSAPVGLNREATLMRPGLVAIPWIVEDLLDSGDGRAHPLAVAFLECVARIAAGVPPGAATRTIHLRWFADMPVLEPIRVVGRADPVAGDDVWQGRAAAIDEEEIVYAMASVEARRVRPS